MKESQRVNDVLEKVVVVCDHLQILSHYANNRHFLIEHHGYRQLKLVCHVALSILEFHVLHSEENTNYGTGKFIPRKHDVPFRIVIEDREEAKYPKPVNIHSVTTIEWSNEFAVHIQHHNWDHLEKIVACFLKASRYLFDPNYQWKHFLLTWSIGVDAFNLYDRQHPVPSRLLVLVPACVELCDRILKCEKMKAEAKYQHRHNSQSPLSLRKLQSWQMFMDCVNMLGSLMTVALRIYCECFLQSDLDISLSVAIRWPDDLLNVTFDRYMASEHGCLLDHAKLDVDELVREFQKQMLTCQCLLSSYLHITHLSRRELATVTSTSIDSSHPPNTHVQDSMHSPIQALSYACFSRLPELLRWVTFCSGLFQHDDKNAELGQFPLVPPLYLTLLDVLSGGGGNAGESVFNLIYSTF